MILADEFREHCQWHMLAELEKSIYEDYPENNLWWALNKQVNGKKLLYTKIMYILKLLLILITASSIVVKALCYKPEGHGFETWWSELSQVT
jgi:hypothetical protein